MPGTEDWDRSVYTQDYVVVVYSYIIALLMMVITTIFMVELFKHRNSNSQSVSNPSAADSNVDHDHEQTSEQVQRSQDIKMITRASVAAIGMYLLAAIPFPPIFHSGLVTQICGHFLGEFTG
eukprot:618457_1